MKNESAKTEFHPTVNNPHSLSSIGYGKTVVSRRTVDVASNFSDISSESSSPSEELQFGACSKRVVPVSNSAFNEDLKKNGPLRIFIPDSSNRSATFRPNAESRKRSVEEAAKLAPKRRLNNENIEMERKISELLRENDLLKSQLNAAPSAYDNGVTAAPSAASMAYDSLGNIPLSAIYSNLDALGNAGGAMTDFIKRNDIFPNNKYDNNNPLCVEVGTVIGTSSKAHWDASVTRLGESENLLLTKFQQQNQQRQQQLLAAIMSMYPTYDAFQTYQLLLASLAQCPTVFGDETVLRVANNNRDKRLQESEPRGPTEADSKQKKQTEGSRSTSTLEDAYGNLGDGTMSNADLNFGVFASDRSSSISVIKPTFVGLSYYPPVGNNNNSITVRGDVIRHGAEFARPTQFTSENSAFYRGTFDCSSTTTVATMVAATIVDNARPLDYSAGSTLTSSKISKQGAKYTPPNANYCNGAERNRNPINSTAITVETGPNLPCTSSTGLNETVAESSNRINLPYNTLEKYNKLYFQALNFAQIPPQIELNYNSQLGNLCRNPVQQSYQLIGGSQDAQLQVQSQNYGPQSVNKPNQAYANPHPEPNQQDQQQQQCLLLQNQPSLLSSLLTNSTRKSPYVPESRTEFQSGLALNSHANNTAATLPNVYRTSGHATATSTVSSANKSITSSSSGQAYSALQHSAISAGLSASSSSYGGFCSSRYSSSGGDAKSDSDASLSLASPARDAPSSRKSPKHEVNAFRGRLPNPPPSSHHHHSDMMELMEKTGVRGQNSFTSSSANSEKSPSASFEERGRGASSTDPFGEASFFGPDAERLQYKDRRRRNNEAAKRCRANRRAIFEFRSRRVAQLERENVELRERLTRLRDEFERLKAHIALNNTNNINDVINKNTNIILCSNAINNNKNNNDNNNNNNNNNDISHSNSACSNNPVNRIDISQNANENMYSNLNATITTIL